MRALPRDRRREHRMPRARRVTGHANRRLADGAEARHRRPCRYGNPVSAATRSSSTTRTRASSCCPLCAAASASSPISKQRLRGGKRHRPDRRRAEAARRRRRGVPPPGRRRHALAERAPASASCRAARGPLRPSPQTLRPIPPSHAPRQALPVKNPPRFPNPPAWSPAPAGSFIGRSATVLPAPKIERVECRDREHAGQQSQLALGSQPRRGGGNACLRTSRSPTADAASPITRVAPGSPASRGNR